jgi:hypothetical protein
MIQYYTNSVNVRKEFADLIADMGEDVLAFIKNNETRWGGIYRMLERVLKMNVFMSVRLPHGHACCGGGNRQRLTSQAHVISLQEYAGINPNINVGHPLFLTPAMVRKCEEIVAILKPFYEANLVSAIVNGLASVLSLSTCEAAV